MKAKTARTILIAGTIIGGVMYFSQTAKAQSTRYQTVSAENRVLRSSKMELAQQVTNAEQEFLTQAQIEGELRTAVNQLSVELDNYKQVSDALINRRDMLEENGVVGPATDAWSFLNRDVTSLQSTVNRLAQDNSRSMTYRNNNLIL